MENPLSEWWYAIKTYQAPSEEQLSAIAGEPLQLLDDSDNEWWYCLSPRTELAGYIPALFIESTEARRARLNTAKNKQLTLAQKEDYDNKPRKSAKKKKVEFDQSIYFDDGTSMSAAQRKSTFKRRSLSAFWGRKMMEQAPEPARDLRAEMGVLRIYADIWNLEATYRAVKVTGDTTAEEVLKMALERFNAKEDDLTAYALYLCYDNLNRRMAPHECPFKEQNDLPEKSKANAKIFLKKLLPEKDAIPVRIYGDENSFKTIMVDRQTTVDEAVNLACKKFKLSVESYVYTLREVKNGTETLLEPAFLLFNLVTKPSSSEGITQKFFLARKPNVEPNSGDYVLVKVYSHGLDLDIAYRAVSISRSMRTEEVIRLSLERYNSFDNPSNFVLALSVFGKEEQILNDDQFPLVSIQEFEKANPTTFAKLYLRKRGDNNVTEAQPAISATNERILMSKMPMRVYVDFLPDDVTNYKTVLVSDTTNTSWVLKSALEKFKISNVECHLAMSCDQTGITMLDNDDIPLLVRNELLSEGYTNIKCVIRKGVATTSKNKFPLRVFVHKVWPDEGYKTIIIDTSITAAEIVALTLTKFKKLTESSSNFVLCLLDVNEGPDIICPDEYLVTQKSRSSNFAIRRKTDPELANLEVKQLVDGAPGTARGSISIPPKESLPMEMSKAVANNTPAVSSPLTAGSTDAEAMEAEYDEDDEIFENPLLANDEPEESNNPMQRVKYNAMTITVQGSDVEGTISPTVIRERPLSILADNPNMLKKLNEALALQEISDETSSMESNNRDSITSID